MLNLLWLIPALPFAGFLVLTMAGKGLPKPVAAIIGAGSVGLSAVLTLLIGSGFLLSPPQDHVYTQTLWTWMQVGNFSPSVSFTLDALSLVMIFVITFVGFIIHLYATEFMQDDEGYSRFFAYMNLFVGSMLTLVLADNLLLLYLGWEGVGVCSYLLIGFWYTDPANGRAAHKAFIVTRVGDTALIIGLVLLFTNLGTLNIRELLSAAQTQWPVSSTLAVAAAALLLGGAVGKSAQLPLHVWLPDAMAGPTPVSALIHAATMVTAGVYLIARTNALFTLAPVVQSVVALIGAATLLLAGFSAFAQHDLKRVLAYSTISQIGYMFLALGVGAWSAALFHFLTHAFFKALLFLGAGVVINALGHEHNMHKMGGLRKELPIAFWTFLIGAASLSSLPLVTAGFYSKDLILWQAWSSPLGSAGLWAAGLLGAFITSMYAFRMLFLTFFGAQKTPITSKPGGRMKIALIVLAVLSVIGGFIELPRTLGDAPIFSRFMSSVLPETVAIHAGNGKELLFQILAACVSLGGVYIAYVFFLLRPEYARKLMSVRSVESIGKFWFSGWDIDALYDMLFIRPFVWITRVNKNDFFDRVYTGIVSVNQGLNNALIRTQTGNVRWYAAGIAVGAVVLLGIVVLTK